MPTSTTPPVELYTLSYALCQLVELSHANCEWLTRSPDFQPQPGVPGVQGQEPTKRCSCANVLGWPSTNAALMYDATLSVAAAVNPLLPPQRMVLAVARS